MDIKTVATPLIIEDKVIQVALKSGAILPAYIGASDPTVISDTAMMLNMIIFRGSFL